MFSDCAAWVKPPSRAAASNVRSGARGGRLFVIAFPELSLSWRATPRPNRQATITADHLRLESDGLPNEMASRVDYPYPRHRAVARQARALPGNDEKIH